MLNTSTHDSKRSGDVRARLAVLSEIPDEWRRHVVRWGQINRRKRGSVEDAPAPSRNDEYLLYQNLLGIWPLSEPGPEDLAALGERMQAYMVKALREAKIRTSWLNPNPAYEEAVGAFVRVLLRGPEGNTFLDDFVPFARRVARWGLYNSLSQTLLKLTAPGVPDLYQGNELWQFSLVDPDNRRAVDYEERSTLLGRLEQDFREGPHPELVHALLEHIEDGRAKLYLTWRTLGLRRERQALFADGEYVPLPVEGDRAEHVCAFARRLENDVVITVAPRWYARLAPMGLGGPPGPELWGDTRITLPEAFADLSFVNVLTGEHVRGPDLPASVLLSNFSVALLA